MYLIAGLGNPGEKYRKTFHNVGFLAVEDIAISQNVKIDKLQCKALTGQINIGGEKVILAKPQTYMNLSGESISELAHYYKIPTQNIVVIYDDVDLEKGSLRIRKNGSSGTHNGMRNIVAMLGSEDFPRIRIGTHDKDSQIPLVDYVLSEIKKEDYPLFTESIQNAGNAALDYVSGMPLEKVMQKYNKKV